MNLQEIAEQVAALAHEDAEVRWQAINALAAAADAGGDLTTAVPALADRLGDEYPQIRQQAAYTLVSIAEHGGDIHPSLSALAQALADEEEGVRKEVVWALYCLAYDGRDIEGAVAALERCPEDGSRSVRGNGAIGLALHYLNSGREKEAEQLLKHRDGSVQFGAAWGHTDHYLQKEDNAGLQRLIRRVRPGLLDVSLRDGLAGSLDWARHRGVDISFALAVIQEMLSGTQDALAQAPLYGILMKLNRRD